MLATQRVQDRNAFEVRVRACPGRSVPDRWASQQQASVTTRPFRPALPYVQMPRDDHAEGYIDVALAFRPLLFRNVTFVFLRVRVPDPEPTYPKARSRATPNAFVIDNHLHNRSPTILSHTWHGQYFVIWQRSAEYPYGPLRTVPSTHLASAARDLRSAMNAANSAFRSSEAESRLSGSAAAAPAPPCCAGAAA